MSIPGEGGMKYYPYMRRNDGAMPTSNGGLTVTPCPQICMIYQPNATVICQITSSGERVREDEGERG